MSGRRGLSAAILLSTLAWASVGCAPAEPDPPDWTYFGGDRAFTRYAPLDQIDRESVHELRIAWRRPSVDTAYTSRFPNLVVEGSRQAGYLRSTPIFVDGVLYAPNGIGLVEAFDPATGETLWVQEAIGETLQEVAGRSSRGVAFWADGTERRLLSVRKGRLHALDPETGRPVEGFGDGGRVSVVPEGVESHSWSSGPIVVGDVVVVAGILEGDGDAGNRWRDTPPEDVRGYDVRTGEHRWTFHVVPRAGEPGVETWGEGSWRHAGDQGSWCCLSADEERGIVYVPLGAPTAAYYGGHRPGDNLFANSLVALDAATGERIWHFQMVHHDLWEYDVVGPPTLGRIEVAGRMVEAVMQPAKTGFLYTFDRVTGEPVWPIEERPVSPSTVPGEHASPTQPFPTRPPAFGRQGVSREDLVDFTPELRRRAEAWADTLVLGDLFTPPVLPSEDSGGKRALLQVPGIWGSGNWHTGAFDPETGIYYAVSHLLPRVVRLTSGDDPGAEMAYWYDTDWGPAVADETTLDGIPVVKPPWGRITALDMNAGEELWSVANGDPLPDHPALEGIDDLQPLGIASRPVPLVTRSLLFIGEGSDVHGGTPTTMWGRTFRAYDKATGAVVWETELPSATTGGPMTYVHEGKQYVVVAVGSREHVAEWVALALP